MIPGWTKTKAVLQTIQQAKGLQKWIEQSTGDKHYATPVLAIPGWYINTSAKPRKLRISNKKNLGFLAKKKIVLTKKTGGCYFISDRKNVSYHKR